MSAPLTSALMFSSRSYQLDYITATPSRPDNRTAMHVDNALWLLREYGTERAAKYLAKVGVALHIALRVLLTGQRRPPQSPMFTYRALLEMPA